MGTNIQSVILIMIPSSSTDVTSITPSFRIKVTITKRNNAMSLSQTIKYNKQKTKNIYDTFFNLPLCLDKCW